MYPMSKPGCSIDDYFEESYEKSSSTWRLNYWILFVALGIANAGDSTEMTSMSFILADEGFTSEMLDGDVAGKGSILASTIFAGMLVGGLSTGAYGDGLGRRPMLLFGLLLNTISGFASALAPSFYVLCVCRVGAGVGIGAILSSLVTLATETSPRSRRGLFVTFVSSFWTVGTIFTAVMALLQLSIYKISWRFFLATCAVPCLLGLISVYFLVPESARYHAIHGEYEKAASAANKVSAAMGYKGSILAKEFEDFYSNKKENMEKNDFKPSKNFKRMSRDALQSIRLLYCPELRRRTLALQLTWCLLSAGTSLCTWMNTIFSSLHVSNVYVYALIFSVANIPGNIAAALLLDSFSRKTFISLSMICSSCSLLYFAYASNSFANQHMILFGSCVFHAFLVCNWCAINTFTSEQFPTKVRGTGMGVCAASGRIASMIMQYVYGGMVGHPTLMIIVSSGFFLLAAMSPVLIQRDMKGEALMDEVGDTRNQNKKAQNV